MTKEQKSILLAVALVVILGVSVYYNSVGGKFVWDDFYLIKNNKVIQSGSNISDVFTKDIGSTTGMQYNFYRPLQMLVYAVNYSLVGLDVELYHVTSIMFHIFVGLCILWLTNILCGDKSLSLLTAVFYTIHPVHTDAVTYVSGLADPMAGFFMLLCFIFYIKNLHSKNKVIYLAASLSFVLALLSKESAIILPGLLLIYHYAFREKIKVKEFIFFPVTASLYFLLRMTIFNPSRFHIENPTTIFDRLPGFFAAIATYVKLLLAPFNLHVDYGTKMFFWANPMVLLGLGITLLSLIFLFSERKKKGLVFFAISWFFVALLPVSNLYPLNFYMTEHWLYIPAIGFFLILARWLVSIYRNREFRIFAVTVMVCLLSFYSYLTIRRNEDWKDPERFYKATLENAPDSFRIISDLGVKYYFDGKNEEAIELFKRSIGINPRYAKAHSNLGMVYNSIGKYEEAMQACVEAIEGDPDYADSYNNLGEAYRGLARYKEAEEAFKKAIELRPDHPEPYNNLGVIYKNLKRYDDAIEITKEAIALDPDFETAYYNLGNVYIVKEMPDQAIESFRKAIELDPDYAKAHNNLAAAYYFHAQEYDLAIKHCDRAIELGYEVHPDLLGFLRPHRK